MSRRQRWGMLVFLVGLPYVRTKAQQYFERLRGEDQERGDAGVSTERPALGPGQVRHLLQG